MSTSVPATSSIVTSVLQPLQALFTLATLRGVGGGPGAWVTGAKFAWQLNSLILDPEIARRDGVCIVC